MKVFGKTWKSIAAVSAAAFLWSSTPLIAAKAKEKAAPKPAAAAAAPVDLNSASQKDLEALPGVGAATAKKIVAGRPYSSVADLSKAGVSAKTIEKLKPLVTVGAAPSPKATAAAPEAKKASTEAKAPKSEKQTEKPTRAPAPAPAAKTEAAAPASDVVAQKPPSAGMVWVNTATKVFHREGDPWYGKTKHGKFMTEADALKAGYRESKEGMKKK